MCKRNFLDLRAGLSLLCVAAFLSGCGGGSGGIGGFDFSMPSYYVGGTVSGLSGTLVLQNNGGDDLTIKENGVFTFHSKLGYGDSFKVTVLSRPDLQNISILSGSGTVEGPNVMNIEVVCSDKCWTHPKELSNNISPDGQSTGEPKVAMDDNGNAVIVWHQWDISAGRKIFMSEYRNGTWLHPKDSYDHISPVGSDATSPKVAVSNNGDAVIAWKQDLQIFMSEYRKGAWKHPKDLSEFISVGGCIAGDFDLAMDDIGNTVITWKQRAHNSAINQVFKSEYRQGVWIHPQDFHDNISPDGTDIYGEPCVAMDNNGNAVIVWNQYDNSSIGQVFKSEYRQGYWTLPIDLSDNISPDGKDIFGPPKVAMDDNNNVVITWAQYDFKGGRQIFKSEYRQGTWFHPKDIKDHISPGGPNAWAPYVAMDNNNNAIITWHQYDENDDWKLQIFKSEYRQGTWTHPIDRWDNISPDGQDAAIAPVAMDDNGNAVIAWHEFDGSDEQIFMSEYRHGVWTHPANLSDNISPDGQDASWSPDVALDNNGNAIIVWMQIDNDQNWQIFKSEFR